MPHIDVQSNSPPAAAGQISLDELERRIRDAHAGVGAAFSNAVHHALTAGQALNVAKPQVAHGQWQAFLKRCDLNKRTAQRYMQLAELAPAKASSATLLADLSIERAIKCLSPSRQSEKSVEPKEVRERHNPERGTPAKTTYTDIIAAWIGASSDEKTKAIDSIGLESLLAAIPQHWLLVMEQHLADRRQIATPPHITNDRGIPDDLSIPTFLQREQPELIAAGPSPHPVGPCR
jgi:hypothetical protein